jgi:hypothetical protein
MNPSQVGVHREVHAAGGTSDGGGSGVAEVVRAWKPIRGRRSTLATTLGHALRPASADLLEVDPRDRHGGCEGVKRLGNADSDNAHGGSGHVIELAANACEWLQRARRILSVVEDHDATCSSACLRCLLTTASTFDYDLGLSLGDTQNRPMRDTSKPANRDRARHGKRCGGRPHRCEQCFERRQTTSSDRAGAAGMAAAAYREGERGAPGDGRSLFEGRRGAGTGTRRVGEGVDRQNRPTKCPPTRRPRHPIPTIQSRRRSFPPP